MELELMAYRRISEAREVLGVTSGLIFVLELQAVFSSDQYLFMVMVRVLLAFTVRKGLPNHFQPMMRRTFDITWHSIVVPSSQTEDAL